MKTKNDYKFPLNTKLNSLGFSTRLTNGIFNAIREYLSDYSRDDERVYSYFNEMTLNALETPEFNFEKLAKVRRIGKHSISELKNIVLQ